MQRLTLILSDLYLPEEDSDAPQPQALALPHFEWLLRFSDASSLAEDWRAWLSRALGVPALAERPVAEVAARACMPRGEGSGVWMATPVSLSARMDHVRLEERGLLRVDPQEAGAWSAEFAGHFAPRFRLQPAGERGFLLVGMDAAFAGTTDPARLLGMDIADALPRGTGASSLRQLGSEVEMWLHGSPLNAARALEGRPRFSTLWFWGGGGAATAGSPQHGRGNPRALRLHGADPFLVGLAAATGLESTSPPAGYAMLDAGIAHHVVELSPMTGSADEALSSLETHWFAPARRALMTRALSELTIIANDRCFRIAPRAHWRFWRRRRGWFPNLRFPSRNPKA